MLKTPINSRLARTIAAQALALARRARLHSTAILAGTVISILVVLLGWNLEKAASMIPRIHDITTDTEDPPQFVALLPQRLKAPNGAAYGGSKVAEAQKKGYPDIKPALLGMPPAAAFERALAAARGMGWEIAAANPLQGRIEATATTRWLRFKDDVVIRIVPQGDGTRLDVRSMSRIGRSDLGANAKRIHAFLARLHPRE